MEKQEMKWLKWAGNVEEYGEIECPMLGDELVMTYYHKGAPCYYSYTASFLDDDGTVCYYRYDHDMGAWDDDTFVVCDDETYRDNMEFWI